MENGYKEEIAKLLKETDKLDFRIRTLRDDNENLTAENDKEIERLYKEKELVEFSMKDAFIKSGEEKVQTNMGFTTWKTMDVLFNFTDKAIPEIEKEYSKTATKYIKVTKALIKGPLKKDILDEKVALSLESLRLEPQKRKFVYKYTGGNK